MIQFPEGLNGILSKLETELLPVKDRISDLIVVLDSVISSVNDIMDPSFKKNLNGTIANLGSTSETIDRIVGSKEKELQESVDNLTRFSRMLSESSEKISNTFTNLDSISGTLAASDINSSVENLRATLEQTSVLLENLNDGKGSAGQLLTDDSLYTNLSLSLENLNELLIDLKEHPGSMSIFLCLEKR
jgi:phospholipid/cholesterol/gamma-HCH transport system substrate-binding protein